MKSTVQTFDAHIVTVHDGDTIDVVVTIPGAFGMEQTWKHPLRLSGLNCPELSTPAGLTARDFTIKWLTDHPGPYTVITRSDGRDKYGRILGQLHAASGACLNDDLLASGNAVVMKG